jgi:uncharacterized protein
MNEKNKKPKSNGNGYEQPDLFNDDPQASLEADELSGETIDQLRQTLEAPAHEVPVEAFEAIKRKTQEMGGEWEPPKERLGSIGATMFDLPSSSDGTVVVLLPKENIEQTPRQSLVRIKSLGDERSYLGAVVEGPFAEPNGLRGDAPIIVSTTVQGGLFLPKYHGRIHVQLMGEEVDGSIIPHRRRPLPNSPVFVLSPDETAQILGLAGEIRLGIADGYEEMEVNVPKQKSVLPRHIGILGTTGGGKSTTVSGQIAQYQKAGIATIILDTEGEYTAINEPTNSSKMQAALRRRGLSAKGIDNTHLYHLVGRDTANDKHPRCHEFTLDFSELSPYTVKEILDLTEAQERRFFQTYDLCKKLFRDLKIYPANKQEQEEAQTLDEFDTGYPKVTLSHLIDIAGACLKVSGAKDPDALTITDLELFNPVFKGKSQVLQAVKASSPDQEISWRALLGKFWQLKRLGIFDNRDAKSINYQEMLQPSRVSIVDLSDLESAIERNLVIAQLLRNIQVQQDLNYQDAIAKNQSPTPTMVLIEEAHEFLSTERIKKMPMLFQQVARIAKRGRKRWLGLVFITQLPQHLPDEVLGLINNWILHKISDSTVVSRLRRSVSGIDDSLWNQLPALAPGQAIVSFTSMARPLQVTIDPTPCKLLMID